MGMGRKKVPSGPPRTGREASWSRGVTVPELCPTKFLWGCLECGQAGEGQGTWAGGKMDYETLQRPELAGVGAGETGASRLSYE